MHFRDSAQAERMYTVIIVKHKELAGFLYYQALQRNNIMAELHIYPKGGHGFGLINPTTPDRWLDRCRNWMIANGWLK